GHNTGDRFPTHVPAPKRQRTTMASPSEIALGGRSENYWPLLRRGHQKKLRLLQKPWFSRICDVLIAPQSDFGRSGG
ncbi:MAG: hypothetical protein WBL84_18945, partial [Xanthobacteraceae bacterium]